jgi:hypothetical protein
VWRVPTFSWASIISKPINGTRSSIDYRLMSYFRGSFETRSTNRWRTDFYATVVETMCVPTGKDLTRRIQSSFVVLQSTLIEIVLRRSDLVSWWEIAAIEKPLFKYEFTPDINIDDEKYGVRDGDVVHCLKLIGGTRMVQYEDDSHVIWIVLKEVGAAGYTYRTFERVGLLQDKREQVKLQTEVEDGAIVRDALVKIM